MSLSKHGDNIEQVNTSKYLDCSLSSNEKHLHEVKTRIAIEKHTILLSAKLKKSYKNNNISKQTKIKIVKA